MTCYKGYSVNDGECVADPVRKPEDLGCRRWDWDNQVCLECSEMFVFMDGVCVPVSDHCAEHDDSGACTACYKGYSVIGDDCVIDPI